MIHTLRGRHAQDLKFDVHNGVTTIWNDAFDHQELVGYDSFIQGFWCSGWNQVQQWHSQQIREEIDIAQWSANVVSAILTYVYECWKLQNNKLHNTDNSDDATTKIHQRVRALYMDPDRHLFSTREKRRLFSQTLEKRLTYSNATLESWIDVVELRLRLDREEHARRTLVRWIELNNQS